MPALTDYMNAWGFTSFVTVFFSAIQHPEVTSWVSHIMSGVERANPCRHGAAATIESCQGHQTWHFTQSHYAELLITQRCTDDVLVKCYKNVLLHFWLKYHCNIHEQRESIPSSSPPNLPVWGFEPVASIILEPFKTWKQRLSFRGVWCWNFVWGLITLRTETYSFSLFVWLKYLASCQAVKLSRVLAELYVPLLIDFAHLVRQIAMHSTVVCV